LELSTVDVALTVNVAADSSAPTVNIPDADIPVL